MIARPQDAVATRVHADGTVAVGAIARGAVHELVHLLLVLVVLAGLERVLLRAGLSESLLVIGYGEEVWSTMTSAPQKPVQIGLRGSAQLGHVALLPYGHDWWQALRCGIRAYQPRTWLSRRVEERLGLTVAVSELIDPLLFSHLPLVLAQNQRVGSAAKEQRLAHLTQKVSELLDHQVARLFMRRDLDLGYVVDWIEEPQAEESLLVLHLFGQLGNVQSQSVGNNQTLSRTQVRNLFEQDSFDVKVLDHAFDDDLGVVDRLFEATQAQNLTFNEWLEKTVLQVASSSCAAYL